MSMYFTPELVQAIMRERLLEAQGAPHRADRARSRRSLPTLPRFTGMLDRRSAAACPTCTTSPAASCAC
jgi:hypothetical protein